MAAFNMRLVIAIILAAVSFSSFGDTTPELFRYLAEQISHASPDAPPFVLTSRITTKDRSPTLTFRLTNTSSHTIEVLDSMLPWGNPSSITLVAFAADGRKIPHHYPIADPFSSNRVKIEPGQSLEGDYDLRDRLMVERLPRDSDILIAWTYRWTEGPRPWPIATGIAVIPKRGK